MNAKIQVAFNAGTGLATPTMFVALSIGPYCFPVGPMSSIFDPKALSDTSFIAEQLYRALGSTQRVILIESHEDTI